MKQIVLLIGFLVLFVSCNSHKSKTEELLTDYIEACNEHDFDELKEMIAGDAVWYLGLDTLTGRGNVMKPLHFDEGAQTKLFLKNISVKGDTAEFELVEKNLILKELGLDSLTHFLRFGFRENMLVLIESRKPPEPLEPYRDNMIAFYEWLQKKDPASFNRFIDEKARFQYTKENGKLMAELIKNWSTGK